jgi:glycosyltransferase involved in cell wall biosynthesis
VIATATTTTTTATVAAPAPGTSPTPWLSILLPVFNVGAALDDCLAAILDQGMAGLELVLVDDASPGDDAARIEAWRARHPDVLRVVRHASNQGVAAARNTLLAEARGTYLWFVDPDDVMEPGALASLKAIVDESRPDLVTCDFRTFSDGPPTGGGVPAAAVRRAHVRTFEGRSNVLSDGREDLVAGLFRTGQLHPWTKIVRREAWPASLRFPPGRVFEDLAVYPRVALAARTHFHVPEVWISYRQRGGSILATLDERKLDDWTLALTGYARDLRAAALRDDADMLFEVSHFCARTMLRAVRRHRRLPATPGAAQRLRSYVARWAESSPLDSAALSRAYLARRMFGRWAQWRWTMWRLAR